MKKETAKQRKISPMNFGGAKLVCKCFLLTGALMSLPMPSLAIDSPMTVVAEAQQAGPIKGTVVDQNGDPVPGANVYVKGKNVQTITDINGNFSLNCESEDVIVISFIGFLTQELPANSDLSNILLPEDIAGLEEIVVVGAGTQKKVSVTGSISSIKGDILHAPSSSLTSNLSGKLAGVMSRVNSGEPGAASEFYIRGVSTFGGRATPLILMDGIEISTGDLNRVPAESIESFSILKDASATAIYGARGANGVMLITTKTGQENQKAQINVKFETSLSTLQNMVEYVDGARFMELYNEAEKSRNPDLQTPTYSNNDIEYTRIGLFPEIYPDVDWQDLMFKKHSWSQRGNINISGGGSKITYYMALQLNHDTGMLDIPDTYSFDNNINNWEYDFRNNLSYAFTQYTKVTMRLNAQFGKKIGPGRGVSELFQKAFKMNPVLFPATYRSFEGDEHIRFGNVYAQGKDGNRYHNPYAEMLSKYQEDNYSTINASVELDQQLDMLTKGLSVKVLANLKSWSNMMYQRKIEPYYYELALKGSAGREEYVKRDGAELTVDDLQLVGNAGSEYIEEREGKVDDPDKGSGARSSDRTYYIDARINYDRTFNEVHNVGAMLMYMQREFRNGIRPNRNQGFSGRATYDYDRRYLAEFNCGYNGTERMASGERFEFFPAVSVGWVPSGEEFWTPLEDYIDFFKIRASYGIVGSDETGEGAGAPHYLYEHTINLGGTEEFRSGYEHNNNHRGPNFVTYPVEDAHWERVKKLDLGVDVHFFKQLNVAFDYFTEKRDRILMKRASFPKILGYGNANIWSNIGEVENKGFDLSVNWNKQINKDWIFDARFNLTYNNNKYKYKDEPEYPYTWQLETGYPLQRTVGYIAEGLFASEEEIENSPKQTGVIRPGDIKYRDVNGDGIINNEDQVMISPYGGLPRIQYGFGFNVTWRKIDAGVFFTGSAKRTIMINNLKPFCAAEEWDGTDKNVIKFIDENHWSEDNPDPNAKYPRLGLTGGDINNNHEPSTYWKRSGDFLRFKTAEIGYSFKYGRVYVSGDNLAVFSKFKEWDPELNWDSYPLSRIFNLGVQFTL